MLLHSCCCLDFSTLEQQNLGKGVSVLTTLTPCQNQQGREIDWPRSYLWICVFFVHFGGTAVTFFNASRSEDDEVSASLQQFIISFWTVFLAEPCLNSGDADWGLKLQEATLSPAAASCSSVWSWGAGWRCYCTGLGLADQGASCCQAHVVSAWSDWSEMPSVLSWACWYVLSLQW